MTASRQDAERAEAWIAGHLAWARGVAREDSSRQGEPAVADLVDWCAAHTPPGPNVHHDATGNRVFATDADRDRFDAMVVDYAAWIQSGADGAEPDWGAPTTMPTWATSWSNSH